MNHLIIIMIFFIILLSILAVAVYLRENRLAHLENYWDVELGMPEDEMLEIMGDGYNRSLLKNGRIKYEWRIEATSYGSSSHGFSTRTYSGVKKVTIYTKDGIVEEVKPYNV